MFRNLTLEQKLHYTLRIGIAMCFIGHGAFGIITKEVWCNYFAVFGIGKEMAYTLMPWVGSFDIACGILMLVYPIRAIPVWLVIWGITTALLRPLSGEPFAEFVERGGNFGVALTLLILSGGIGSWRNLITRMAPEDIRLDSKTLAQSAMCLKVIVFLLLLGHGWLNLIDRKGLIDQYASLGFSQPGDIAFFVGLFEVIAAIAVLVKPIRPMLFAFFIWKMATELFYPHWAFFEWVERGGSYTTILALWYIADLAPAFSRNSLSKVDHADNLNTAIRPFSEIADVPLLQKAFVWVK